MRHAAGLHDHVPLVGLGPPVAPGGREKGGSRGEGVPGHQSAMCKRAGGLGRWYGSKDREVRRYVGAGCACEQD